MVDEEDIENGPVNFGTWRQELEMIYPALHNNLVTGQVMMLEKSYVTISIQMVKFPGSGTFYNLPDLIVILLAQFVF